MGHTMSKVGTLCLLARLLQLVLLLALFACGGSVTPSEDGPTGDTSPGEHPSQYPAFERFGYRTNVPQ